MGKDNNNVDQQQHGFDNNNMQLCFVEILEPSQDPIFTSRTLMQPFPTSKSNPEVVRQWARHFSLGMTSQRVDIPHLWLEIFTTQLLNPLSFVPLIVFAVMLPTSNC